jgi:flagellar basal-body rod protein FlgG
MGLSHQALYIATAGAYANQRKLEAITNNLANASTYGYKKNVVITQNFPLKNFIKMHPISPYYYT